MLNFKIKNFEFDVSRLMNFQKIQNRDIFRFFPKLDRSRLQWIYSEFFTTALQLNLAVKV